MSKIFGTLGIIVLAMLVRCTNSGRTLHGTVLDFDTGNPIPDAVVTLSQETWGIDDGNSFTLQKPIEFETNTDADGNFRIENIKGEIALFHVAKTGYSAYSAAQTFDNKVVIKLKSRNPDYAVLPSGTLEIGMRDFRPYGWDFSEANTTFSQNEADIFPVFNDNFSNENMLIEITASGGIQFIPISALGVEHDLFVYTDLAPVSGYLKSFSLDFEGEKGIYFVETQNNTHAKFLFDPNAYTTTGSARDHRHGNWGILLNYIYNPDGSLV